MDFNGIYYNNVIGEKAIFKFINKNWEAEVDENVKIQGRIPTKQEIKEILSK